MTHSPRKINYALWGLIAAFISAGAAVATIPAVGCFSRLNPAACRAQLRDVELIAQAETGESLANVKIQVIAQGAPEVQYTDDNGYAKVQIPSEGDVRVTLSKEGYPPQDFNLNVENAPSTVRIIRFSESGQPDIEVLATAPSNPGLEGAEPGESVSAIQVQSSKGIFFQLKGCNQENDVLSCELLVTDKDQQRDLTIYGTSRPSRIIDTQGNQHTASSVTFGNANKTTYVAQPLAQDVPLKATLMFNDPQVEDSQLALVEVSAYTRDQSYFTVQFRDVRLSR